MNVNIPMLRQCLRELTDIEFQRRTWLAESGPEISSFPELVSQTFDDTGLSDALDSFDFQGEIGKIAVQKLKALDYAILEIDQSLASAKIIEHSKMVTVRQLAQQALDIILI